MSGREPFFEFEKVFDPEDYLYFYKDWLTEERSEEEADFIEKALELEKDVRILDLACGHGRISNRLAKRGYSVVGLDKTHGFLEIAEREAEEMGVEVEYVHGDMRELPWRAEFDGVISFYTSFGYFSDQENLQVLREVNDALKQHGKMLIDVPNRERILREPKPTVVDEVDGNYIIDRSEFDHLTGRMNTKRTIIREGRTKTMHFSLRLYTYTELAALLTEAGLQPTAAYGSVEGESYDLESHRLCVVSEKVG